MKDIQGHYRLDDCVYLSGRPALILFISFIVTVCYLFWSPYTEASAWVSPQKRTLNSIIGGYRGEFSWTSEESNMIICNADSCSVAICHFSMDEKEKCVKPSYSSTRVEIPRNATVKVAQAAFVKKNGTSGIWDTATRYLEDPTTCFGVMYWQGPQDDNYTGLVIPGSYCGKPPPSLAQCDLMGDVVFDYGPIAAEAVQGASRTKFINVQCTDPADIVITLTGNRSINLGGGITSKLSINGVDLSYGARISAPKGSDSLRITSTLSAGAKPTAGNYSGSGVVVLGYQ